MKPYVPSSRVAVRESFDEDLSDDIEDDVFIRDGKSIKVSVIKLSVIPVSHKCAYVLTFYLFYSKGVRREWIETTFNGTQTPF